MSLVKNRNYTLDITGMTHEGQGVGRIDGMAVFVEGALEGERVEVKIVKVKKSYAFGKLISILQSSPDRITPFCPVYRSCGGCNLQHMDYMAQLRLKTGLVKDALERLGGFTVNLQGPVSHDMSEALTPMFEYADVDEQGAILHDTIGMVQPMSYRNKAQYPVALDDGKVITGFYAPRSHNVVETDECGIQNGDSERVRRIVSRFLNEKGISAYDEVSGQGLVRHIVTRVGFSTGELMVVLVVNGETLPYGDELVKRLTGETWETWETWETEGADEAGGAGSAGRADEADGASQAGMRTVVKSIYLNINTKKTNVIMGKKNILLYGNKTIRETIGAYRFMISPNSFFQVNPVQTGVLYEKVLEYAALTGKETVFDLYCGIGTISVFLAGKAARVYGVEIVEEAVVDARQNARINGVDNAEFICGEAEKVVAELYSQGVRADVAVVDPPRKGCDESLLRLLAEMQPDRIVYVSCNPATLARDARYLADNGYRLTEAQPVDMFPWTGHVECVILMQR